MNPRLDLLQVLQGIQVPQPSALDALGQPAVLPTQINSSGLNTEPVQPRPANVDLPPEMTYTPPVTTSALKAKPTSLLDGIGFRDRLMLAGVGLQNPAALLAHFDSMRSQDSRQAHDVNLANLTSNNAFRNIINERKESRAFTDSENTKHDAATAAMIGGTPGQAATYRDGIPGVSAKRAFDAETQSSAWNTLHGNELRNANLATANLGAPHLQSAIDTNTGQLALAQTATASTLALNTAKIKEITEQAVRDGNLNKPLFKSTFDMFNSIHSGKLGTMPTDMTEGQFLNAMRSYRVTPELQGLDPQAPGSAPVGGVNIFKK